MRFKIYKLYKLLPIIAISIVLILLGILLRALYFSLILVLIFLFASYSLLKKGDEITFEKIASDTIDYKNFRSNKNIDIIQIVSERVSYNKWLTSLGKKYYYNYVSSLVLLAGIYYKDNKVEEAQRTLKDAKSYLNSVKGSKNREILKIKIDELDSEIKSD